MKIDEIVTTGGNGLWSKKAKDVNVIELKVPYEDEELHHGELRAVFDVRTWSTEHDGLVYSDRSWMAEFREMLKDVGFSSNAALDVEYSEMGMQGEDFVSMDVGGIFLAEWKALGARPSKPVRFPNVP